MIAKPYYVKLNSVSAALLVTSVQLSEALMNIPSDYSQRVFNLGYEIRNKLDSVMLKISEAELGQPLIFDLEEELCLYACIHVIAGYTDNDNFMEWFYEEMQISSEERLPTTERKKSSMNLFQSLKLLLSVIEGKLSNEESFLKLKNQLDKHIPLGI